MSSRLTVTTPWYPTPYNRMAGSFVAEHARLAASVVGPVRVVQGLEWPGGTVEAAATLQPAFDAVLARASVRVAGTVGPLDRVPVFTVGGTTWAQRAQALVRDVRAAVGELDSPLVHGHVGYLGGVLAARLAPAGAKVFATEHSTALRDVLADPAAADLYAELLDRAEQVWCVSGLLRDQVLERVADPHDRLRVVPNPVDFTAVATRESLPDKLSRWVYVGGLHERKGVERLVRAFSVAAREDRDVTLTMMGDGALADRVRALATDAGVGDRLQLLGVVPHESVLRRLPEFDVLFAPSRYETFHLAVVEAVAAGVPVVVTRSGGPQEALAGVEHLVGRFVDVEDSPDLLVDAWRDLGKHLDTLDLATARATLDARYGTAAIRAELVAAYGIQQLEPVEGGDGSEPSEEGVGSEPVERIVIVATSGWRRYSVEADLAAARELAVPTVVVTADPQLIASAAGLTVVPPKGVELPAAARASVPDLPLALKARRLAGTVKRRLTAASPGAVSRGAAPVAAPGGGTRGGTLGAAFLAGATVVVTDCQSMPLARAILEAYPSARPVFELPHADPVDGP